MKETVYSEGVRKAFGSTKCELDQPCRVQGKEKTKCGRGRQRLCTTRRLGIIGIGCSAGGLMQAHGQCDRGWSLGAVGGP